MRQEDHSGTSGISMSLLWERISSLRLGSSKTQWGIVWSSLCCRSSFKTCKYVCRKGGRKGELDRGGAGKGREQSKDAAASSKNDITVKYTYRYKRHVAICIMQ